MVRNFILFIFFLLPFGLFSQQSDAEIEIIHFNSSVPYASNSSISIHINPKGLFDINNEFSLQISNVGDDFTSGSTTIKTIQDFYTPLMTTSLPNLDAGLYKLRIKASLGLQAGGNINNVNDYSEIFSEELDLTVVDSQINSPSTINSPSVETNANFFECLDSTTLPRIGSNKQGTNSNSSGLPSSLIVIAGPQSNTINATLYDILNNTSQNISVNFPAGAPNALFNIPEDLPIGTYTIEVHEIFDSFSSISSFAFIWHTNTKTLSNLDDESICVGSPVGYIIPTDIDNGGVGNNYLGSRYTLDFGDGTNPEVFTHAYLLVSNQFIHQFDGPSCILEEENQFLVEKKLFNKLDCDEDYEQNGSVSSTQVNASVPPEAFFNLDDEYCIEPSVQSDLIVLNQTQLGQYSGANSTDCQVDVTFTWEFSRPVDNDVFIEVNEFFFGYWRQDVNGDGLEDLVIPYSDVEQFPGCWDFKLNAENNEGAQCNSNIYAEGTVQVRGVPTVDFDILDENNQVVTEICPNDEVTFSNLTDLIGLECQALGYQWTITPIEPAGITDFANYLDDSTQNSQSPNVRFTKSAIYQIDLTVSNSNCTPQSFSSQLTVLGTPEVIFSDNSNNEQICLDNISNNNPHTVDFSSVYTPQYSVEPFLPDSYNWEISGDGISSSDYAFVNNTSSASEFPVIEFYSFECYTVTISVNSDCESSSTDSFNLSIDQNPQANFNFLDSNNNDVTQICPNDIVTFNDLSLFSDDGCQAVGFNWDVVSLTQNINSDDFTNLIDGSTFSSQNPSVQFTEVGVFEVTLLVSAGNCPFGITTKTIIVEGTPSVDINSGGESSDQICLLSIGNSNPHVIDFSQSYVPVYSNDAASNGQVYNAPTNFLWEISGSGITESDYSFINNTSSASQYPVIEFYSFGDYDISSTVSANCGTTGSDTFSYAINEIPVIDDNAAFDQTVCSLEPTEQIEFTSSMDNVVFSWSVISSSPSLSGFSSGNNNGNIPQQTILNNSDSVGEVIYEVIPSTNDCTGSPVNITLTINPAPSINDVTQTICDGDVFENINPVNISGNIVPEGTEYSWVINEDLTSDQISGAAAGSGSIITGVELSNSSALPQNLVYTVSPVVADTNCEGNEFNITITVNPDAEINDIGPISVCSGEEFTVNPSEFENNIIPAGTVYSWETPSNSNSALSGMSSGSDLSSIVQTINSTASSQLSLTYIITPKVLATGCEGDTFEIVVNIDPEPNIDDFTQTICDGDTFISISPTDSENGVIPAGTEYEWVIDNSSSNFVSGGQAGSGSEIIGVELTNSSELPQDLVYLVTPTVSSTNCLGEDFLVTITVNPIAQVDPVESLDICNEDIAVVDFTTSNGGVDSETTYSWEITSGDSVFASGALTGTGNINLPVANDTNADLVATITVTPTYTNNGVDCTGPSEEFTITVNPTPDIIPFDDLFIPSGSSTNEVTLESNSENTTFSWVAVAESGIIGLVKHIFQWNH